MACEYPGDVHDLDALWAVRRDAVDTTGEAPWSRWDTDALLAPLSDEDRRALQRMRYGAFLSDEVVESFSAGLFGISQAEAKSMDPGQRLCLETSYRALQDAGHSTKSLGGEHIGVYVGASGVILEITNRQLIRQSHRLRLCTTQRVLACRWPPAVYPTCSVSRDLQ